MTRQRNKGNHGENIAKELRMMGHTATNREVGIKAKWVLPYPYVPLAFFISFADSPHPVKIDLSKKLDLKQKTIQTFNIDAQGFRKTKDNSPLTWEKRFAS